MKQLTLKEEVYDLIQMISIHEQARVSQAVFNYTFGGVDTTFTGTTARIWERIKKVLSVSVNNSGRGGAPKGNQNAKKRVVKEETKVEEVVENDEKEVVEKTTEKQPKNNRKTTDCEDLSPLTPSCSPPLSLDSKNIIPFTPSISPPKPSLVGEKPCASALTNFLYKHKNVIVTSSLPASIHSIDFEVLEERWQHSTFLQEKPHDLAWIARNYPYIAAGGYEDKKKDKEFNVYKFLDGISKNFEEVIQ